VLTKEIMEAKMLESPTWKHRKYHIAPEPFHDDERIDSNLKKLQLKNKKKGNNISVATGKEMN
jgi:hypothetical protein